MQDYFVYILHYTYNVVNSMFNTDLLVLAIIAYKFNIIIYRMNVEFPNSSTKCGVRFSIRTVI